MFDRVWSCLIKFEGHQTFDQKLKTFLWFSCLMGDVLFVWTAAYQTCLMRACVPRLLSGLYQLFDLCSIMRSRKAWFPYNRPDRPDRPSRLKKCSDDRDDHMETLPRRSQTTRAIQNLHDRPDRPDRTQFYPSDRGRLSRPGRLRSSG